MFGMRVLGIESTCDETACAVVEGGKEVLAHGVYSQAEFHAKFGGVVPEMASRQHIDCIGDVLKKTLAEAGLTLREIDLIAVASGPGLLGSLLVGLNFAKGLSFALNKPLVGVNHLEAHLFASFIEKEPPPFPAIGVVISGGHTALLYISKMGEYSLIGETQDDAIGEAFDKVASLLSLPYPGGPAIEKLAKEGDSRRFPFQGGRLKGKPFDFSFSGLKTAALYLVKGQNGTKEGPNRISESDKKDVAASFQEAALRDIVEKTSLASAKFPCKSLLFGGGVAANQRLRELFAEKELDLPLFWPEKKWAVDNAVMIAQLGFFEYKYREKKEDLYHVEAFSSYPIAECRL